jgi:hypothetical protein
MEKEIKDLCAAHQLFCPHRSAQTLMHWQLRKPYNQISQQAEMFCSRACLNDYLEESSEGTWNIKNELEARGIINLQTMTLERL